CCSIKHLEMISKPLIIYSIGYNRFRNQEEFDDIFFEHIRLTADKAAFFSVRNIGSKKALMKYNIPEEKIVVNHCPSLFYKPKIKRYHRGKSINIGINLAGDRAHLRFAKESFYDSLRRAIKDIREKGYELHFFNHNWNPQSNCQDLIDSIPNRKSVHDIETMWNRNDIDSAINLYMSMDLIIAMRGHSQMIPFGQGKKVISLISHDKLSWFLEDVNMEDTGVDVNDGDLVSRLISLIDDTINSKDYPARQERAMDKLRSMHLENNRKIRGLVL
ncbi:polysaccharide pyruvyl transferase family protein, partial [Chloroflexota bacterium]